MPLMLIRQNITKMKTDAIVAAEGHRLTHHGWVGSAIADAAGDEYQKACEELGFCDTGDAKITKGYNLPAKYVIHATGPDYQDGHHGESVLLHSCYINSLKLAKEYNCKSIAFPVISTGGYGYPKDEALKIATDAINGFLEENEMDVYLVTYDKETTLLSRELNLAVEDYIEDNYEGDEEYSIHAVRNLRRRPENLPGVERYTIYEALEIDEDHITCREPSPCAGQALKSEKDLEKTLKNRDESFQQMLFRLIAEKKMKNSEVYTRANISKSHFSKIKNDVNYRPKKETVFAFAIALKLDIDETNELMKHAGFAISHSFILDTIVEYFIVNENYNIMDVNFALFDHDQPLLGEKAL